MSHRSKNNEINTLTGILIDTSSSMKESYNESKVDLEKNDWIKSLIHSIDELVLHDLEGKHDIFVIGVGSSNDKTFDILNTIKSININKYTEQEFPPNWIINKIMNILKGNGAPFIFDWTDSESICKVLLSEYSYSFATLVLSKLEYDIKFIMQVVGFLPETCKNREQSDKTAQQVANFKNINSIVCNEVASGITMASQSASSELYSPLRYVLNAGTRWLNEKIFSVRDEINKLPQVASENEIKKVIYQIAKEVIVYHKTIFSIKEARNILHANKDLYKSPIDEERTEIVKKNLEPFIYGLTPLNEGLVEAAQLMSQNLFEKHKKFLFVFSDGVPTDFEYFEAPLETFKALNVTILSGLITNSTEIVPMHLYCEEDRNWAEDAQYMYRLSSTITTEDLPRSIFVKNNWKIEYLNNKTKLFLQINHCENMKEVSKFAKDVICSHEALSDALAFVSLDIYINRYNSLFKETPGNQEKKPTCYAYAVGTVIHLSLKRILGKDDIPEFRTLVEEISEMYNYSPANTKNVLANFCDRYKLIYKKIDLNAAKKKIVKKIPVIALFYLSDAEEVNDKYPECEWKRFFKFFGDKSNKKKFFSKTDLTLHAHKRQENLKKSGHAVVLTSFNSEGLQFMNSWGAGWGDNGFFRVAYGTIEFTFFYVGWHENDLTEKDKHFFKRYGNEIAKEKWKMFEGLKNQKYLCPICKRESLVRMFSGNLSNVSCPKCKGQFEANGKGNILALNIYLTSLM